MKADLSEMLLELNYNVVVIASTDQGNVPPQIMLRIKNYPMPKFPLFSHLPTSTELLKGSIAAKATEKFWGLRCDF